VNSLTGISYMSPLYCLA